MTEFPPFICLRVYFDSLNGILGPNGAVYLQFRHQTNNKNLNHRFTRR